MSRVLRRPMSEARARELLAIAEMVTGRRRLRFMDKHREELRQAEQLIDEQQGVREYHGAQGRLVRK
jgi:hypothetical protein